MFREQFVKSIGDSFEIAPICALLGPRQCGKTTLSKHYVEKLKEPVHFFDLEDHLDIAKLENPKLTLEPLQGLIVIDEIQRRPELFPMLRVLVDKSDKKFLILGSVSQELIRQSSETLAGRINYIEMTTFNLAEVRDLNALWVRGGFPRSYLAKNDTVSNSWRKTYIKTFLEKDIRGFGFDIPPQTMRRFWMMLAHYHGQIFNASEIGQSIGVTYNTSIRYLDILSGTFMMRPLAPWYENIGKRQVKSPKVYFRDSGLFHTLLNIESKTQLMSHPKLGCSWEGLALEEVIRYLKVENEDCYFWATQSGAELDLLITKDGTKKGFEFKFTDSPKMTKSMHIALNDLQLDDLTVIIPGRASFKMYEKVQVLGLEDFLSTTP